MDPDEAVEKLEEYRAGFVALFNEVAGAQDFVGGFERLERWKQRVMRWLAAEVSAQEAERFGDTEGALQMGNPAGNFQRQCEAYDAFLGALIADIQDDPEHWEDVLYSTDDVVVVVEAAVSGRDTGKVFIGHGGSPHWARIQRFLEQDLGLETVGYESESRLGSHIVEVLNDMMDQAGFAVIVLTAEDFTEDGRARARQNVVHEVGLFQGRLGFERTVVVLQDGVEEFSNIAGLQQVRFSGDRVQDCFEELRRFMSREGLV